MIEVEVEETSRKAPDIEKTEIKNHVDMAPCSSLLYSTCVQRLYCTACTSGQSKVPGSAQLYSGEKRLFKCTLNVQCCSAWHKAKTLETKCKPKL